MTKEEMLELRTMMVEVVQEETQKLRTEMKEENQKLLMNIIDVVENQATQTGINYEHNVDSRIKALDEENDILKNKFENHEQRIVTVERKVGLAI